MIRLSDKMTKGWKEKWYAIHNEWVDRGGGGTGIRCAESGVVGAESGVGGAGVEGAGSGDRGGGESGKIGAGS